MQFLYTIAISSLLYVMDTINWSVEEKNKLEIIQNRVVRMGMGADKMVGVEAIRGDMGWILSEERLFKRKFIIRLEKMDGQKSITKK